MPLPVYDIEVYDEAFDDGKTAFIEGRQRQDNPHRHEGDARRGWIAGYNDALFFTNNQHNQSH